MLGKGDNGTVYDYMNGKVVKMSKLPLPDAVIQLSERLAGLGISPSVHLIKKCGATGVLYDMDKIRPWGPSEIRKLESTRATPFLHEVLSVISIMVDKGGVVHFDNHYDNWGFLGKKIVVYDFDFAQLREFDDVEEREVAKCFTLAILLERFAQKEHRRLFLRRKFQEMIPSRVTDFYEQGRKRWSPQTLIKAVQAQFKNSRNRDIYVGLLCYMRFFDSDGEDSDMLDYIYLIRQHQILNTKKSETTSRTLRRLRG
jgi:hypothetical protein